MAPSRTNGVNPRWDKAAEASVLGAVMLRPESLPRAQLRPEDFYLPQHRLIWSAMLELVAESKTVDPVLLEDQLGPERVRAVGGLAFISELIGIVPTADNIEHYAQIVRDHALARKIVLAASDVTQQHHLDGKELAEYAEDHLWPSLKGRPQLGAASVIGREWRALDHAYLTATPLARRWLLRHPTRDGQPAPPNDGDGMLPAGKVAILSSEGGVGKTTAGVSLAVCLITGRPWLGWFHVDWESRGKRVCLLLAEEDHEEVHRKLFAVAEMLRLTEEEIGAVTRQLVVLPLAGRPVALVQRLSDGTISDTPELLDLRRRLQESAGEAGWGLVVLDPLARWAGADVEADTNVATRFVQALETLTEAPGFPTVMVPHHSSKMARRTGGVDARGVTAITDAARWAGTLRADGTDVLFQQVKSNYSRPMPDELRLLRSRGGLLRVPTDDEIERLRAAKEERQEEREADEAGRRSEKIARLVEQLVAAVAQSAAPLSRQAQLKALVPGSGQLRQEVVTHALAQNRLVLQDLPIRRYVVV